MNGPPCPVNHVGSSGSHRDTSATVRLDGLTTAEHHGPGRPLTASPARGGVVVDIFLPRSREEWSMWSRSAAAPGVNALSEQVLRPGPCGAVALTGRVAIEAVRGNGPSGSETR